MQMKELLSREEYRGNSYKLLSECYYLPDEKLIEILNGIDKSWGWLYSEIARSIPELSDIESIKIDYSKLFLGPNSLIAPPYGSVYLENTRRVMGDSTMDVMNRYREEGLDISIKEVPDHIAIELEFMYLLIFKQVEAIRSSNPENAASYLRKQQAFLESHLGMWVPEFANNIEANGQTEFYKNLARSTKLFVEEDLRSLSENSILLCEKAGGAR